MVKKSLLALEETVKSGLKSWPAVIKMVAAIVGRGVNMVTDIKVGRQVLDSSLKIVGGGDGALSIIRGRPAPLHLYLKDDSSSCTKAALALTGRFAAIRNLERHRFRPRATKPDCVMAGYDSGLGPASGGGNAKGDWLRIGALKHRH